MGRPLGEAAAAVRWGGCACGLGGRYGRVRVRARPRSWGRGPRAEVAGAAAAGEPGKQTSAGGTGHCRSVSAAWGRTVCPSVPGPRSRLSVNVLCQAFLFLSHLSTFLSCLGFVSIIKIVYENVPLVSRVFFF